MRGGSVEVHWAHLMERQVAQSQGFFFGPDGIMNYRDFWSYLRVPYPALLESLAAAGEILKKHVAGAVRKGAARSIRRLKL